MRWLRTPLIALGLILLGYVVVRSRTFVRTSMILDPNVVALLRTGGAEALTTGDVPVAAVLLLDDRPIGVGHNTVLRNGEAGGHAEINAVSDAMRKLGHERFHRLDRDSLVMVTTFEPCAMCRGMLLEYRIGTVIYNEPKSLGHWMRDDLHWLWYEWTKRQGGPEGLQDSLFRAHPRYPG